MQTKIDGKMWNKMNFKIFGTALFFAILNSNCKSSTSYQKGDTTLIVKQNQFKHYVDYFNTMEDENIKQAIPNDSAWVWMKNAIPFFECPQQNFEEIYYFRWWSARKHLKKTPQGFAISEFLVPRSYADKYNMISSALGHHINEFKWLHDSKYLQQNIMLWYRGQDGKPLKKQRNFSSWNANALYTAYLVNKDGQFLADIFPDLVQEYAAWESDRKRKDGLFWQFDVKDGMEESLSGGRKIKNARPTINSYMYGNAQALSKMAKLKGDTNLENYFKQKADTLQQLVQTKLWNADDIFFETLTEKDTIAKVREAIGFIPWYFNLPQKEKGFEKAWEQLKDDKGFSAPFGLTTAERRSPRFRTHGTGTCEWDGAIWPFATSQTLTAMINLLNNYTQNYVDKTDYFKQLNLYVESHYYRGKPYIGEYLDETTGYWLMGDRERSRYYNHSTFSDLVISGLVGLQPRADELIEINPLIPQDKWDWFCLDGIVYHGNLITIVWDKTGNKYHKGKGFTIYKNGKVIAFSEKLEKVISQ